MPSISAHQPKLWTRWRPGQTYRPFGFSRTEADLDAFRFHKISLLIGGSLASVEETPSVIRSGVAIGSDDRTCPRTSTTSCKRAVSNFRGLGPLARDLVLPRVLVLGFLPLMAAVEEVAVGCDVSPDIRSESKANTKRFSYDT